MNVNEFVKGLIEEVVSYVGGEKLTATEYNNILNKIILQGNNNAEGTEAACQALADLSEGLVLDGSVTESKLSTALHNAIYANTMTQAQYLNFITLLAREKYTALTSPGSWNKNNLLLKKSVTAGSTSRIQYGVPWAPIRDFSDGSTYATTHSWRTVAGVDYLYFYPLPRTQGSMGDLQTISEITMTWLPVAPFNEIDTLNTTASMTLTYRGGLANTQSSVPSRTELFQASPATLRVYFTNGTSSVLSSFNTLTTTTNTNITVQNFALPAGHTIEKFVLSISPQQQLKTRYYYHMTSKLTLNLASGSTMAHTSESIMLNPTTYSVGTAIETVQATAPTANFITNTKHISLEHYETESLTSSSTNLHYFKGISDTPLEFGFLEITPAASAVPATDIKGYWFIG